MTSHSSARAQLAIVSALLILLAGCTVDPGGALLRSTAKDRYRDWAGQIADDLDAYKQAHTVATNLLHASVTGDSLDKDIAVKIVDVLRPAERQVMASLQRHPYPGGPPLSPRFQEAFTMLLGNLDRAAEDWTTCTSRCTATFNDLLLSAGDVRRVVVSLLSYERLASPLSSRRHEVPDGLISATSVGNPWVDNEEQLTPFTGMCLLDELVPTPDGPIDQDTAALWSRTTGAVAEHTIMRFTSTGAAEQFLNDLRLQIALCRDRPRHDAGATDTWSANTPKPIHGLPTVGWERSHRTSKGHFTVTTVAVLVADTVSQVSVTHGVDDVADQATTLSEQALTQMWVEVPK